nr:reverse transcriptase domain-containing protein [Tanacetum cinerariifolium]
VKHKSVVSHTRVCTEVHRKVDVRTNVHHDVDKGLSVPDVHHDVEEGLSVPELLKKISDMQWVFQSRITAVEQLVNHHKASKIRSDSHVTNVFNNSMEFDHHDLLPDMLAQVGNQGNVRNQNGNVVNENIQENDKNVLVNGNHVGCSYKEFVACNPKEYEGKGGVVVLTRWIENIENMQDMSGCSIDQKVKYIAGSFVGKALTWWNSQIRTLSQEVIFSISWNEFKFMMIEEFCPSHEMQS